MYPSGRRVRSSAEKTEPDWVTSAIGPVRTGSGSWYPIARSPWRALTKPMHPAPHRAIPAPRASVATWSLSPSPCAPPKITADRSPRCPASSTCPASAASGTPSSTRSTGSGSSARDGWHGIPPIAVVFGVDQVHCGHGRAARDLGHHPLAEGALPRAGTHQGHAACFEHRLQRSACVVGHERRERLRRLAFLSAIAAFAACMPGMPHTPPPACVAELA